MLFYFVKLDSTQFIVIFEFVKIYKALLFIENVDFKFLIRNALHKLLFVQINNSFSILFLDFIAQIIYFDLGHLKER